MRDVIYKPLNEALNKEIPDKPGRLTWEQLCLLYGKRIFTNLDTGSIINTQIYTVPQGKVFMLISASICVCGNENASPVEAVLIVSGVGSGGNILHVITSEYSGSADQIQTSGVAQTICPSIPIKVIFGESLYFFTDSNDLEAAVTVFGYEVDQQYFDLLI